MPEVNNLPKPVVDIYEGRQKGQHSSRLSLAESQERSQVFYDYSNGRPHKLGDVSKFAESSVQSAIDDSRLLRGDVPGDLKVGVCDILHHDQ